MRTLVVLCLFALAATAAAREPGEAAPDTLALAKMSPEELFIRASSAELQYAGDLEPARRLLVRRHGESIPYLVTELDTDQPRERIALENIFVRIGEDAVPSLVEALAREARRDDTTRGARLAAYVLARIGDPAAVHPLVELREHDEWKMRSSVADALGHLGGPEAVETLVGFLDDEDDSVRKAAAASLDRAARDEAELVLERAVDGLLRALEDDFYGVRYAASDALGRLGDEVVPHLAERVVRAEPRTRMMTLRSLGLVGGRDALRAIAPHLEDDDWAVRAQAAEAAGDAGTMSRSVRRRLEAMAGSDPHPLPAAKAAEAASAAGS